ncbi:CDP-alcohol phosphatidyltransferase family protein [uncultured Sphingomonas sp.]|uniref:CDP-alcohol phosphatidyltransferase family protein n=1 Tax=uncultured Sphingomonas sp. TaxID=158754 RepID=UPI0025F2FBDF|nr:CDP-alcohol phosphatidyltransferase family protein [uncultured Sphingomonas sp.]
MTDPSPARALVLPKVRLVGTNPVRLWGLTQAQRVERIAAKAGLAMSDGGGPILLIDSAFAFDPQWLGFMRQRPGAVLTLGGRPVIAHVEDGGDAAEAAMLRGAVPAGLSLIAAEDNADFYNEQLRKRERPFLALLTPEAVPGLERQSYYGAYKGVTDILTKYLWPELALVLTRWAARVGISPNMVTTVGALCCVIATVAFWQGHYWLGMGIGFVFMVLDTVDGKLARCTITSSYWGNIFDHGLDLVHPLFWWWAWAEGLPEWGLALTAQGFAWVMGALVAGYILQRVIEGWFIRRFGMHIHVWRRFDSQFRLITARRNPNMVILFFATLLGRPDLGLIAVAWWTILSCVIHAVRGVQAQAASRRAPITSWLHEAP